MVVSNDLLVGGVQRNIVGYFRGLDTERFDPHLVLVCEGGPLLEQVSDLGVDARVVRGIAKLGPVKWIRPGRVNRLATLMRDLEIDVVQTRLFLGNTIGRRAAAKAGVPVVVAAEHSTYFAKTFLHMWIDRRLAGSCRRIVAVSETVKKFTVEQEGLDPGMFTVIHNGLDMSPFDNARPGEEMRSELGIPAGAHVLFSAARLIPEKGYAEFMGTLALLAQRLPDVLFVLAGHGPDREAIEKAAGDYGVGDKLLMLGERNDVPDLLQMADLFVLPSRREGLPTAVIEALAAGCPPVCNAIPQAAEVVDHGIDGLLVDFSDREGAAEAILGLLSDGETRRSMSALGRDKVRERFTLERMVGSYMDLYEELFAMTPA